MDEELWALCQGKRCRLAGFIVGGIEEMEGKVTISGFGVTRKHAEK
ncbi:hypothetical protein [Bartonella grahamii]|nr:hypothetical protein [Bartonella grahamii]